MKGDFTRLTFDRNKQYSAVHLQQGRVALDADWNEQVAIDAHLRETALTDLVGKTGAPLTDGGFKIEVAPGGRDLLITPGRFYVDGILCELAPGPVPFGWSEQPVSGESVSVEASDALVVVERRPAPGPTGFNVYLSLADFHRLGLAPGDVVKLLFLDLSRNRNLEIGPYGVLRTMPVQSGEIAVTLDGNPAEGMGPRRLRRETTYLRQPYRPGNRLPPREGTYLVYLDVWKRHVTALEDPEIREVALGGPDTATRTQVVWQVKLFEIAGVNRASSSFCLLDPEGWASHRASSSGRLLARTSPPLQASSPCVVPTDAGYTLLENQLYRVEVHLGSDTAGGPTFKWSRDNGTVASAWQPQPPGDSATNHVQVASLGRDEVLDFDQGQWIELTDDARELEGLPGLLVKITAFQGETLIIEPPVPLAERAKFSLNPKVRRWDHITGDKNGVPATVGGWIPLEGSLEIAFDFNLGNTLRTGDYWLIPARAFIGAHHGSIEWPRDSEGDPLALLPHGIEHHYARLAVVDFRSHFVIELEDPAPAAASRIALPPIEPGPWEEPELIPPTFSGPTDCRRLFPAVTELTRLVGLCACDQEALPGKKLPQPIGVAVFNGEQPVADVRVQFTVTQGGGTLQGSAGQIDDVVKETTDENGLAFCDWILGPKYDLQRVTAVRLDAAGHAIGAEECFSARQSVPALHKRCGDHQRALPNERLPQMLGVVVFVEHRTVKGARVLFMVEAGGGTLGAPRSVTEILPDFEYLADGSILFTTLPDGVVNCLWTLGPAYSEQQVKVSLLDTAGDPLGPSVYFTAAHNLPDRPSFFVEDVYSLADRRKILNDSPVTVDRFAEGLRIACTEPIAPESVAATPWLAGESVPPKPACAVVLDLPLLVGEKIVGFQPILLKAEVIVKDKSIHWTPSEPAWLQDIFIHLAYGTGVSVAALRVCLTLQGNLIWALGPEGQPAAYLAGKPLGKLGEDKDGRVDLVRYIFPPYFEANMAPAARTSGAPVAGSPQAVISTIDELPYLGTEVAEPFTMWFWLLPTPLTRREGDAAVQVSASLPAPELQPAPSLAEVRGIGPVLRARLEEAGITQPAEVAAMEPARLAETLRVSETQAKTLIENAKRVADA